MRCETGDRRYLLDSSVNRCLAVCRQTAREERKEKSEEKWYPLLGILFKIIDEVDTFSLLFSLLSLL